MRPLILALLASSTAALLLGRTLPRVVGAGGSDGLLDLGAAQTIDNDDQFGSFQTLTHGFAPPEQYLDGNLGPWTDIYGLAATIYNCITGTSPPPALKRREGAALEKLTVSRAGAYPYTLLKVVEDALSLDQGQRPADMHAFLSLAFGASSHKSGNT